MSLRTLIEINHDVAGREDTGLLVALARYVRSANREHAEALEQYGLRVIGMRHHSGNFIIEGDEPDGFPVKFMPRAPAATEIPESRGDGVQEALSPASTEGVEEALERLVVYTAMEDAQLATNCEAIIKAALSNRPGPSVEEVAKRIAEIAIGLRFKDLMLSKAEWVALRGKKNGYDRDVNDPFQIDVLEAARQIAQLYQKGGER